MTRWVERFGQLHGGAFPSPHCAAGTVMVYYCARYHRRFSYFVIPLVISFMAGALYGRYHYFTDVIAGIAVAIIAIWVTPSLDRLWISVSRTVPDKLE
jgi:membrane-associated phospholipid phosphatase